MLRHKLSEAAAQEQMARECQSLKMKPGHERQASILAVHVQHLLHRKRQAVILVPGLGEDANELASVLPSAVRTPPQCPLRGSQKWHPDWAKFCSRPGPQPTVLPTQACVLCHGVDTDAWGPAFPCHTVIGQVPASSRKAQNNTSAFIRSPSNTASAKKRKKILSFTGSRTQPLPGGWAPPASLQPPHRFSGRLSQRTTQNAFGDMDGELCEVSPFRDKLLHEDFYGPRRAVAKAASRAGVAVRLSRPAANV
ncbi:hypothetical protein PAL_GLEAN10002189 [Pteropus alecto]|uniref:Uncharacterized protein n=1 Tax=Pteropus alecto TaxID=9402 RepID=L5KAN1_PTEAL|nr:hypothetical protein PAL_GLEAN10002189 [Pteropus alecto]